MLDGDLILLVLGLVLGAIACGSLHAVLSWVWGGPVQAKGLPAGRAPSELRRP